MRVVSLALAGAAVSIAALSSPGRAALATGVRAPDFTTSGARAGKVVTIRLAQALRRGPVVLYFFPAAFTGGCNAEARAFAEKIPEFRRAGATVIGMSADGIDDLRRFSSSECAGKFTVASATPAVLDGYRVTLPNALKGRTIASRTSYVIARGGRVAYVHDDPAPIGHVTGTLVAVRDLARRTLTP